MIKCFKDINFCAKLLAFLIMLMLFSPDASANEEESAEPRVIYQSNYAQEETTNKKDYFTQKIKENEISFLKGELSKQKQAQEEALSKQKLKYEEMLKKQKEVFQKAIEESSVSVIQDLEKKLLKSENDLADQKKANEEAFIQKELEFNMKINALSEQFDRVVEEAKQKEKKLQSDSGIGEAEELTAKIDSLTEKLKIKDNLHGEALKQKEKDYNDRLQSIIDKSKTSEGMDREQEIGDAVKAIAQKDSQISVLEQRVEDLNAKIEKQRKVYDKELEIKEEEYKQKNKDLEEKYKLKTEEEVKELEGKLNEKYVKLDEIIRNKERIYAEEIFKREQEIEKTKQSAQEKQKSLRQMTAEKELEYGQKIEQEKNKYVEENEALKKSSEQLRMYIVKLKEELKTKSLIVTEKNNQIQVLNQKLALYSGEEESDAYKISRVARDELNVIKAENERQKKKIEDLENELLEQKSTSENKLAKQKKTIMNLQRDAEAEILSNSFDWEKKLRLQEAKYIKQIRNLEKENEKIKSDYEKRVEQVSDQLRDKIDKDEKIKNKLSSVQKNQMELLEEMLLSKAKMMQKVSPDFKKEQKDKAEAYFNRAMSAILKKNYARAKYELEEVLLIEPDNQMTINMLGSINFLIEKK